MILMTETLLSIQIMYTYIKEKYTRHFSFHSESKKKNEKEKENEH